MTILINIFVLVVGFFALIKGADFFVEGSVAISKYLKVPSIIVGLTIVAMGTSAPEMAVSVSAALEGSNEIAISNITGSNIFNLLMVLGVCAVLAPLPSDENIVKRDYPFMIIITALLITMVGGNFFTIAQAEGFNSIKKCGVLNRVEGVIILVTFVAYLFATIKAALKTNKKQEDEEHFNSFFKPWEIALYIFGGLLAIVIGGKMVVAGAKNIALMLGMTETLIGLTIVAVGTSLPELVTSVVAAKKGENELAMGNVIGSNIFNILFILGVSATITPIPVNVQGVTDIIIALLTCGVALIFSKTQKKITRSEGIIMILVYCVYMIYATVR